MLIKFNKFYEIDKLFEKKKAPKLLKMKYITQMVLYLLKKLNLYLKTFIQRNLLSPLASMKNSTKYLRNTSAKTNSSRKWNIRGNISQFIL